LQIIILLNNIINYNNIKYGMSQCEYN